MAKPLTATEVHAAKAAGIDLHPAELLPDPPHCEWARDKSPNNPDRYGAELAAPLEKAGERLIDPEAISRSTKPENPSAKRPKRYRAGSVHLDVDSALGNSAIDALWSGAGAPDRSGRVGIVKSVLEAVKPRNELEGLLATQLIAAHAATMECYRRAMIPEQTFVGRSENFNQAAKASRTFAVLLETLDRHRGKGSQQRVRVEHVHVYEGGQAIVGHVAPGGGGRGRKGKTRQPHAKQLPPLAMHLSPRCGAKTRSGSTCQSGAMSNGRCRMHGGASPGAPYGTRNGAYRHGQFTCEAIARRRQFRALMKAARSALDLAGRC